MKFLAIIPARYDSSRFPGKPLADINGVSMVMRVYHQVKKVEVIDEVVVATDDERIYDHVQDEGGKAMMTALHRNTGTERVCEASMKMLVNKNPDEYIIINVQGDEPFIDPRAITSLAGCFDDAGTGIATLMKKIDDEKELFDENVVKVIPGKGGKALYFSRSAIPFVRERDTSDWLSAYSFYKHIGIYAYRAVILQKITKLQPSETELAEGLEQLRWLDHGYSIHVKETDYESISVDTPEDLLKITNKP